MPTLDRFWESDLQHSWEFQSIPPTRSVLGGSLGLEDHSSRVTGAMERTWPGGAKELSLCRRYPFCRLLNDLKDEVDSFSRSGSSHVTRRGLPETSHIYYRGLEDGGSKKL